MTENIKTPELNEASVQAAHLNVMSKMQELDTAFQQLVLLTPVGEPKAPGQPPARMFNPDMIDSLQAVSRSLKLIRLDTIVVAQSIMDLTPEAREAALKAKGPGAVAPDFTVGGGQPSGD